MAGHQDIEPAKATYSSFVSLFKWGALVVIAVTAIVVFIIAGRAA